MFKRLLIIGLLAGSFSGSLLTIIHLFTVIPLIHQAEQFENQLPVSLAEHASHSAGSPEWEPEDGWERLGFTWISNLVIASGFGMMMAGMMSLRRPQNWTQATLFGLAGFYCFFLAPASLLPPELPGALTEGLLPRQGIWLYAVAASILSFALLRFTNQSSIRVFALLVLVSPFSFSRRVMCITWLRYHNNWLNNSRG